MSGSFRRLRPGHYQLVVAPGAGPAGIQRPTGPSVTVGIEGGVRQFEVHDDERVYYWWRGPRPSIGVRLVGEAAMRPTPTAAGRFGD